MAGPFPLPSISSLSIKLVTGLLTAFTMHFNPFSLLAALFVVPACAKTCNRDNCFRALLQYQSQTDTAFCNQYLATPYDLTFAFLSLLLTPV